MGMYTGLRFEAKLSPLGCEVIDSFYENMQGWVGVTCSSPMYMSKICDWIEGFHRFRFIPGGALCYMPSDWEFISEPGVGVWKVCCSLKNYNKEIEGFLENMLPPLLSETCKVEVKYEESKSRMYNIEPRSI